MKTIFSGIKPTGRPHLGNYFGMIRQHLAMQEEGLVYAAIVDYHALNFIHNADEMRTLTRELIVDYLALGFDTEKHILFKQSDIPEHTELCWIFDTITTVPYLKRAHAYKDAVAKGGEEDANVGTFNYPMLMAADILLYDTDLVPVGQDQKQHIEFTRDTAEKFNRIFGETFKLPEDRILSEVETVPGTDGRKMSKSYSNTIPLFATDEEIEEKVMSIVTDSSGDVPQNVYAIHKLFKSKSELANVYEANKGKYKNLKEILIADIKNFIAPLREKREAIANDDALIQKVIESGKERARAQASSKLLEVKRAIGVL
jgi:tryptophanyl-tRNA synthetase